MREAEVRIERMAFGGAGFGRVNGKACFVPFTAPGDLARIAVRVEKSSYLEGELLQLIEASPDRAAPPCPLFGRCGGCHWQHLPYELQLQYKADIFRDTLWRMARVEGERIGEIIAAPEAYGYRTRIQLKARFIGSELYLGFYRGGSHFVVDLPDHCAITHEALNRLIPGLRQTLLQFPENDRVPQVDMATGDDGRIELVIHYIGEKTDGAIRYFHPCAELLGASAVFLQTGRKSTLVPVAGEAGHSSYALPRHLSPNGSPCRLRFANGGFSQVNLPQNIALIETVMEWSGLGGGERVLDLFCGNGNLSIPLASRAASVMGVEEYRPSVDCAVDNCAAGGLDNVEFRCADAAETLKELAESGDRFHLVVLDPPRGGAGEVAKLIPSLGAEKIIYVSCDPTTLARDLALLAKGGYHVTRSRPLDMFPQTYHMESVTLVER